MKKFNISEHTLKTPAYIIDIQFIIIRELPVEIFETWRVDKDKYTYKKIGFYLYKIYYEL